MSRPLAIALRLIVSVFVLAAVILFWKSSLDIFFFTDDWNVLSQYATLDTPDLIRFFFEPHNDHFIPLFKAVYYLQYHLFGLNSMYYHLVNLSMFGASALLLYVFLFRETGDRVAACLTATLYAVNSTYHNVASWVFLESMVMGFAFMMAALVAASRETERDRPLLWSAFFCLLSSVSFGIGITSTVIVALFYVLRKHFKPGNQGMRSKGLLALSPLAAVVLLYAAFYLAFGYRGLGSTGEGAGLLPGVRDTAVTIGDMTLKSFGIYLRHMAGLARESAELKAINAVTFLVFFLLVFPLAKRRKREHLHLVVLGIFTMVFFTAFVMFTRAKTGVYLPAIDRYKYFPFMGFTFVLAPAVAYIKGSRRAVAVALGLLMLVVTAVHYRKVEWSFYSDQSAETLVKMTRESLDRPGTRYIENLGKVKLGHIKGLDYVSFLNLVREPDDRVTGFRGMLLLLKEFEDIAPGRWTPTDGKEMVALEGGVIKVNADEKISLMLKGADSGRFGHLSFRMRSDTPFKGSILRQGEDGGIRRTTFDVTEGLFSRDYLLACPGGRNLVLVIGPGKITIRDMRIYR